MFVAAIVALSAALAAGLVAYKRKTVQRSFKALAPAVRDDKASAQPGYRNSTDLAAYEGARVALELLPSTKRVGALQQVVAALAAPLAALSFGLFPVAGLAAWSAALGGLWGLGASASLLSDNRRSLGALALALLPVAAIAAQAFSFMVFPFGGIVGALAVYGASRRVLDLKDSASIKEANRERDADPKYLSMSTERRAGAIVRSRGGSGSSGDASSARDNLSAT